MVTVQGSPCTPIPQGLRIKYTPAEILSALLEGRAQLQRLSIEFLTVLRSKQDKYKCIIQDVT
jgi:hypothetical protein